MSISPIKYFVSPEGAYLGAWGGYYSSEGTFVAPKYPDNGIEVPSPPADGRQIWRDGAWLPLSVSAPTIIVYPVHLWERMTQSEADAVGAVMAQQDFRTRQIFSSASSYRSDHELWPLLQQIATQLFGAERAKQILAPSELIAV